MRYTCPVCGYDKLTDPPANFEICPCCGTQFDYHDITLSYSNLRERWLLRGARWFDDSVPQPPDWSPYEQLKRAGLWSENYVPATQEILEVQVASRNTMSITVAAGAGQKMGFAHLNYWPFQSGVTVG